MCIRMGAPRAACILPRLLNWKSINSKRSVNSHRVFYFLHLPPFSYYYFMIDGINYLLYFCRDSTYRCIQSLPLLRTLSKIILQFRSRSHVTQYLLSLFSAFLPTLRLILNKSLRTCIIYPAQSITDFFFSVPWPPSNLS